jgi:tetratricopeptide (TPR) repeat protein
MNRRFLGMMRAGAALAAVFAAALASGHGAAAPYEPAHDDIVLARIPVRSGGARAELRVMREALARQPQDATLAVALARRYVELGRADGDPRYSGWAEAALRPWWDLPQPPVPVLVMRATILQNRHQFDAALRDLDRALASAPRDAQALVTRATILRVQGRPRDAAAACAALFGLADPLAAITCLADAGSLSGSARTSYERLRAIDAETGTDDPRRRLWTLTVLAEIAERLGDAPAADRHFREASALGIRDSYLVAAYADFLLDQGRAEDARDLLADETAADALLLRLAIAETRLRMPAASAHVRTLGARMEAARARDDRLHLREQTRFALDLLGDPAGALRLAEENWRVQREPADARLLLEAAFASGSPAAARPVLAWLDETKLEDIRLSALAARLRTPAG